MSCFLLDLGLDRQYPRVLHHTIVMAARYRGLIRDIFDGHRLPPDMSLYLLVPVPHLGHGIDWAREPQPVRDRIVRFLQDDFGMTGLDQAIQVEHRYSPLDFRDHLSSYLGSACSIEPTLLQSAYFRPRNLSEDLAGLYLVGAGTHPGAGLPGVLLSARITSGLVLEAPGRPAIGPTLASLAAA